MKLKQAYRTELSKPVGSLIEERKAVSFLHKNRGAFTASVGDVTTLFLFSHGFIPDVSVIDYRVQRKPLGSKDKRALSKIKLNPLSCVNPAGGITDDAMRKTAQAVHAALGGKKTVLRVKGEDDLLLLPLALESPDNAILFYGQPKKGLVMLKATPEKKARLLKLMVKAFD